MFRHLKFEVIAILISCYPAPTNAQDSLTAAQVDAYFQIAATGAMAHSATVDTIYWTMNGNDVDFCNASHMSVDLALITSYILHLKYFGTCFIETGRDDCRDGIITSAQYLDIVYDHIKMYIQDIKHEALKAACAKALEFIGLILNHLKELFPRVDFSAFGEAGNKG